MSKNRLKKWTLCIVEWEDAVTHYEPGNSADKFPTAIRRTCGFLIRRDAKAITVAMEDDRSADTGNDDCQTVTSIPAAMVRSVTPAVEGEKIRSRRRVKKDAAAVPVVAAAPPSVAAAPVSVVSCDLIL